MSRLYKLIRRPPHVVVKSVNNQRIEHGWGEVNIRITRPIRWGPAIVAFDWSR